MCRAQKARRPVSTSRAPTRVHGVGPGRIRVEGHCVATIEDKDGKWVVDANEDRWLPLNHETLSRCMGAGRQYKSGGAIRAYRFAPGKKPRKFTKRARGDADQQVSKKQKS